MYTLINLNPGSMPYWSVYSLIVLSLVVFTAAAGRLNFHLRPHRLQTTTRLYGDYPHEHKHFFLS